MSSTAAVQSNTMNKGNGFTPNFDRIKTMTEEQLFSNLKQVVAGNEMEPGYREMFGRVIKDYERLKAQSVDQQKDVYTVYERYQILEDMYTKEHERVLAAEEEKWSVDTKVKEQEKTIEQLKQELEKCRKLYQASREEYDSVTMKQALGRKNIEHQLMSKALELSEAKKKAAEKEAEADNLKKQLEKTMKETEQLKEIVGYFQAIVGPQLGGGGSRPNGLQ